MREKKHEGQTHFTTASSVIRPSSGRPALITHGGESHDPHTFHRTPQHCRTGNEVSNTPTFGTLRHSTGGCASQLEHTA
jgi:hypothetical protein